MSHPSRRNDKTRRSARGHRVPDDPLNSERSHNKSFRTTMNRALVCPHGNGKKRMGAGGRADTATAVIDISETIDRLPVGGFQIRVLLTCAAVLFVDGFDTQAIGYVAPAVAQEWKLARGALGPVFSVGLFGLMIGAILFGTIADRIGRKRIIVLSTVAFGIGSLLTMLAQDATWLMVLRFLTGLGLGGAMPNTVALTSELSPHQRRATLVMMMFAGFS